MTTLTTTRDGGRRRRPGLGRSRRCGKAERRRARRRTHRRQHGPAASVDARSAATHPRDRGRDHRRSPVRDRLSAHRYREEPGVPQLDAGRDIRDPDGLPVTVFQRDGVLPRGGEAARRHRCDPGARIGDPGDVDGTQPDLQSSGRARDRRHGTRGDDGDVPRLPRARTHSVGVRDDHRTADEPRLCPARRRRRRSAGRRDQPAQRSAGAAAEAAARSGGSAQRELHLEGAHPGRRIPRSDRVHGTRHHRTGAARHRAAA